MSVVAIRVSKLQATANPIMIRNLARILQIFTIPSLKLISIDNLILLEAVASHPWLIMI